MPPRSPPNTGSPRQAGSLHESPSSLPPEESRGPPHDHPPRTPDRSGRLASLDGSSHRARRQTVRRVRRRSGHELRDRSESRERRRGPGARSRDRHPGRRPRSARRQFPDAGAAGARRVAAHPPSERLAAGDHAFGPAPAARGLYRPGRSAGPRGLASASVRRNRMEGCRVDRTPRRVLRDGTILRHPGRRGRRLGHWRRRRRGRGGARWIPRWRYSGRRGARSERRIPMP
jgi:hypothetical protein